MQWRLWICHELFTFANLETLETLGENETEKKSVNSKTGGDWCIFVVSVGILLLLPFLRRHPRTFRRCLVHDASFIGAQLRNAFFHHDSAFGAKPLNLKKRLTSFSFFSPQQPVRRHMFISYRFCTERYSSFFCHTVHLGRIGFFFCFVFFPFVRLNVRSLTWAFWIRSASGQRQTARTFAFSSFALTPGRLKFKRFIGKVSTGPWLPPHPFPSPVAHCEAIDLRIAIAFSSARHTGGTWRTRLWSYEHTCEIVNTIVKL